MLDTHAAVTFQSLPSCSSEEALLEPVNQCASGTSDCAPTADGDEDAAGSDPLVVLHGHSLSPPTTADRHRYQGTNTPSGSASRQQGMLKPYDVVQHQGHFRLI